MNELQVQEQQPQVQEQQLQFKEDRWRGNEMLDILKASAAGSSATAVTAKTFEKEQMDQLETILKEQMDQLVTTLKEIFKDELQQKKKRCSELQSLGEARHLKASAAGSSFTHQKKISVLMLTLSLPDTYSKVL